MRRVLLEGTDLESLLLRVRHELGPGATVLKAEKVRTGGVAGFFAKEHVELTVDVPDDLPAVLGPLVTPASRGPVGSAAGPVSGTGAGTGAGTGEPGTTGPVTAEPIGLEALLAAADAADRHSGVGEPASPAADEAGAPVSTEQDSFASILDSVRQLASEARAADAAAASPASATPGAGGGAAGAAGAAGASAPARGGAQGFVPRVHVPPETLAGARGSAGPAMAPPPEARASERTGPGPSAGTRPGPVPEVLAPAVRPAEFVVVRTGGATVAELAGVGVPRALLDALPAGQGTYPLSHVLALVPRAPQVVREPASVVVVAGQGQEVVAAAHDLARRMGLPDSAIALAGRLDPDTGYGPWVLTGQSARRLRAATVESETPLVVALGVGADASDWAIASALLAAFDPDQLWAAVEADRSLLDVRRWLGAVCASRQVDAVAARNVAATSAPATVLELGLPVGMLDAFPASAVVWAATLAEHLGDVTWD